MQSEAIWTDSKPRPDKSLVPSSDKKEIVTVLYSEDEERRAVLLKDAVGHFQVVLEVWHIGDVRKASETKVGDRVRVEVEFDSAFRSTRRFQSKKAVATQARLAHL